MIEAHRGNTISRLLLTFNPINFRWDSTGGAFRFSLKFKNSQDRNKAIKLFETLKLAGNFHLKGISLRRAKAKIKDLPRHLKPLVRGQVGRPPMRPV